MTSPAVQDPASDAVPAHPYGWRSAVPPHTQTYLAPVLVRLCRELAAKRVLDIGCGNGALCATLAKAGFDVTGCDPDPEGVSLASTAVPSGRFVVGGVYDPPERVGHGFDVAISAEVVEHLFAPRALPAFAAATLRPGGYLIVTTPYHGYLKNLALSLLNRWDSHHGPLWDGGHIKFWSRATLTRLLEDAGFRVTRFLGVGRVPWLWKSMILVAEWPAHPVKTRSQ